LIFGFHCRWCIGDTLSIRVAIDEVPFYVTVQRSLMS
jgi:hypothetical protein